MFGLGKKKLTDQMRGMIGIELAMFMRWHEDNKKKNLTEVEMSQVMRGILKREKYKFSDKDVTMMIILVTATENDAIDKMRIESNFDDQVTEFMRSIGFTL